jgi:hypothetical protein
MTTLADRSELDAIIDAKVTQLSMTAPDLLRWGEEDAVYAFLRWHRSARQWIAQEYARRDRIAKLRAGVIVGGRP